MDSTTWLIIDTETTGFKAPVYPVEIGAQRMRGWERDGTPFRRLLNQNCSIPGEATRVHGYTPEILERDGEPPESVYKAMKTYVGSRAVVSYNLDYDWDQVLIPDLERKGLEPIGTRGLCALKLAQRLLDPVPAGNCKLQTLRQYYRLPERGAHTALGDVDTVVDLMQQVLKPLAEERKLATWKDLKSFTEEEWFPSRIPFGKFKGRLFSEGAQDSALRDWVHWLAGSSNDRSSRMGHWYLEQLDSLGGKSYRPFVEVGRVPDSEGSSGLVLFLHPEVEQYRSLIDASRSRLADLELEFGIEKAKVDSIKARLFESLRPQYQERDRLRTVIQYRTVYIERLLHDGEEEAAGVEEEYQREASAQDSQYDATASMLEGKSELTAEETSRLKQLWKKLVRMFHPDQFEQDPEKKATYERLTQAINEARDKGDISLLELIAKDPHAFILRQGWASVTLGDSKELSELRSLYDYLQVRILELIETLDDVRRSPDYELFECCERDNRIIDSVIAQQRETLETEVEELKEEADRKASEIEELTGASPF